MSSEKHYFFKGLLLFTLFEILFVLSYFTIASININGGVMILLEWLSFLLGVFCLMVYFALGLDDLGKNRDNYFS